MQCTLLRTLKSPAKIFWLKKSSPENFPKKSQIAKFKPKRSLCTSLSLLSGLTLPPPPLPGDYCLPLKKRVVTQCLSRPQYVARPMDSVGQRRLGTNMLSAILFSDDFEKVIPKTCEYEQEHLRWQQISNKKSHIIGGIIISKWILVRLVL